MAKTTNYTLDRVTGRWRLNGRFCAAPRIGQLRRNKAGYPVDSTGKRVPLASVSSPARAPKSPVKLTPKKKAPKPKKKAPKRKPKAKPKPKPKPKPKKRAVWSASHMGIDNGRPGSAVPDFKLPRPRHKPRKKRDDPQTLYVKQGDPITERKFLSSSFENVKSPEFAGEVLYNTITKLTYKGQISADNLALYQYGIQVFNPSATGNPLDMQRTIDGLAKDFPDFAFRYNENVVHVLLGDPNEPTTRNRAVTEMRRHSADIAEIWNTLADLWDYDIGWFIEAENDEIDGY